MKLRHVRTVAVTAAVLVALTGARKSDGGGCSGDDDNDRSSSVSGGTDGGGSSGGSATGSSGGKGVRKDITVLSCEVDSGGRMTARLRITNRKGLDAAYDATVAFRTGTRDHGTATVSGVEVPAGESFTTEATGTHSDTVDGTERPRCSVTGASRTTL
ncbi:hypothetical protein V1L54_02960 [Streptomyces sp. TRM 70361]|uniref:hypothetical protein n=1 Tax=Streptomyces sp. TRM 70361 TaxID=3116553 RepID=UPI002E7B4E57|nr:hypothetical protein [Streptomyces sp. TRM 70361]MEE1938381.1 hypothetical protein [Streptomyces sp. TRM 70361]